MRIGYLFGSYPNPSETFLERELQAVRAAGLTIAVAALQAGPDGPQDAVLYRQRRPAASRSCAAAAPLPAAVRLARNLPFALRLLAWCQAQQLDLLHATWAGLPAQVAWLVWRLGGPAYTVAGHAQDVWLEAPRCRGALRAAVAVTVCNRAAEQALRRLLPELGRRLSYQPHGLPLAAWPCRPAQPLAGPHWLGVGRLVAKKGFDTLLQAAARLPGSCVTLVGDGPERSALAALAERLGVAVRLLGRCTAPAVRAALAVATALVLPSRRDPAGDRDGLANVLLEALASGVPVVTSHAGSAQDAIKAGCTGVIVPPDDPAALAVALRSLWDAPETRARLAAAGRRLVERRFDLAVTGAAQAAWLQAAAKGARHGR
ncbi:MAG: glycosyltransferase family 4 protein [Fimbriimonadaceae bacterium]|nr:glycosyltransferase family 4 protein [Fimbriimonadaceae bacterium]